MNNSSRIALQVALNEAIQRRDQLKEIAQQYDVRANNIRQHEIPEFDVQIRELQAELE